MKELFIYLIKSSALLTIFYLIYIFLLRKDTFFILKRYFLLIGLVISLILPYIQYSKKINKYKEIEIAPVALTESVRPTKFIYQTPKEDYKYKTTDLNDKSRYSKTNQTESKTKKNINYWLILGILYFSGIIIHTIIFTLNILSLKKLIINIPVKKYKNFVVATSNKKIPPFTFFKKIVINPSLYSSQEINYILRHEIAHATQYHSLDLVILKITQIVLWFHPFIPLYKKSLELNLECIADQIALKKTKDIKDYQLTLLKFQNFNPAPLTLHFYKSLLKNRVIMMNKARTNRFLSLKSLVILPTLCVFFYSFNVKEEIFWNEIVTPTSTIKSNKDLNTVNSDSILFETLESESKGLISPKKEKPQDAQETPVNLQKTDGLAPISFSNHQGNFIHFKFKNTDNRSTIEDKIRDIEKNHGIKLILDQLAYNDDGYISKINISFEDDLGNTGSLSHAQSEKPITDFLLIKELDSSGKTKDLQFFSGTFESYKAINNYYKSAHNYNKLFKNQNNIIPFKFYNTDNKSIIEDKVRDIEKNHGIKLTLDQLEYNDDGYISKINISFEDDLGNTGSLSDTESEKPIADFLLIKELDAFGKTSEIKFFSGIFKSYNSKNNYQKLVNDYDKLSTNPIYDIDGKIYKGIELKNQKMYTADNVLILNPLQAEKKYGKTGKNGAIIITNAKKSIEEVESLFSDAFKYDINEYFFTTGFEFDSNGEIKFHYSETFLNRDIDNPHLINYLLEQKLPSIKHIRSKDIIIVIDGIMVSFNEFIRSDIKNFENAKLLSPDEAKKMYGEFGNNGAIEISSRINKYKND